MIDEKEYRLKVKEVYERIEKAFEQIDPDLAEVETGLGTLSILNKRGKTILSTQPSVRQIWLALAALGIARHFSWNESRKLWVDDKDSSIELFEFIEKKLKELIPEIPLKL